MVTLRIEHAIHDYDTWQRAFDSFTDARAKAGVRRYAIRQPADDQKFLTLDLEFDSAGQAEAFAGFLHTHGGRRRTPEQSVRPRTSSPGRRRAGAQPGCACLRSCARSGMP
jgi:hypothetical protein